MPTLRELTRPVGATACPAVQAQPWDGTETQLHDQGHALTAHLPVGTGPAASQSLATSLLPEGHGLAECDQLLMQPPGGGLSLSRETGPVTLFNSQMREGPLPVACGLPGTEPPVETGCTCRASQESAPPYKQKRRLIQSSGHLQRQRQARTDGERALTRPPRFPSALRSQRAEPLTGLLGTFLLNALNQDFSRFPLMAGTPVFWPLSSPPERGRAGRGSGTCNA